MSFPVEQVNASDLTLEAANKQERVILAAKAAIVRLKEMQQKVTQTAVATMTQTLGFNKGKGYSQQHISRLWQLLISLIEGITSKMSKTDPSNVGEKAERLEAVSQVLNELPIQGETGELLECLGDVFLEWLSPGEWQQVWSKVRVSQQVALLSVLLVTLPLEELNRLVNPSSLT